MENHSKYPGYAVTEAKPVIIELSLSEGAEAIDYLLYYMRASGTNGNIEKMDIFVQTKENSTYMKVDYKETTSGKTKRFDFLEKIINPTKVKFIVTQGVGGFASAAEFKFFKKNTNLETLNSIFTDLSYSELKSGVTKTQLENISVPLLREIALKLYEKSYETARVGIYEAIEDIGRRKSSNKMFSTRGAYDNVTGIYVEKDKPLILAVNKGTQALSITVFDHMDGTSETFSLVAGLNYINPTKTGLLYIRYFSNELYSDSMKNRFPDVKVNIISGIINGYLDIKKNANEPWVNLVNKATYPFFDLKGERALISFTTEALKKSTTSGAELVKIYDEYVRLQDEFTGLIKYNKAPQGRAYFRANVHNTSMYMYAHGGGTEYKSSTIPGIANVEGIKLGTWGVLHELGHTNQIGPLNWRGLTEVTNNLYVLYSAKSLGTTKTRLEKENKDIWAINNVFVNNTLAAQTNIWHRLLSFWQLELYFSEVEGKKDFYKDLHEYMRNNGTRSYTGNSPSGNAQIDFVRIASEISQTDLTEFFEKWGYLTPVDMDVDDYGVSRLTVTQESIEQIKNEIKKYPKPSKKIEYINDRNLAVYKTPNELTPGSYTRNQNTITVTGSSNVAAFEVYNSDTGALLQISIIPNFNLGTLPPNISIYAIGTTGEKKEVSLK